MSSVPTTEPDSVVAGDTLTWKISLSDYSAAAGWTLHYRLINADGNIDIAGTPSGSDHLISVPAATSALYTPGTYSWQSYVTGGSSERYTISKGWVEIKPNWAAMPAGLDTRSTARQILEVLEAAWLKAATNRAYVFDYQIGTRKMKFATRQEWVIELNYWRKEVAREERAERLASGQDSGRKVYVRF